ncbi:MAG TPA: ATP-binding protein, partial [Chloroflexia bacterium]|nr:ATP-binding protein [Chloroflexia bacterium]
AALHDDMVSFQVADTGVGIPAHALPHIYDRFYQVDTGGRARGGTGLGLAITRQLVELHGGTLSVASTPGAGSTFTFTLPLATQG